jgi:hypothetical protein
VLPGSSPAPNNADNAADADITNNADNAEANAAAANPTLARSKLYGKFARGIAEQGLAVFGSDAGAATTQGLGLAALFDFHPEVRRGFGAGAAGRPASLRFTACGLQWGVCFRM